MRARKIWRANCPGLTLSDLVSQRRRFVAINYEQVY